MKLTIGELRMILLVLRAASKIGADGYLYRSEARRKNWTALADKIDASIAALPPRPRRHPAARAQP